MPSSEKRKKRRTETQLRAELLEAHEWAVTACPEAFQLPDSQVVICEVSDSNKLIALGKFEGEGRTFVSFDEIVLDGNSSNITKILTRPSICCSGPYPQRDTEYGAEQLFDLEMLFIPNEPSLVRAHKFNFSTLMKIKRFQSSIGQTTYRLHQGML